ncbi:gustatory receptor for sugar taste 43a-like [Aricia agestis]|uniref:gustatory receptor for sugar taste 43a-like n=1 Tax=Aricia agestis TaxID=91739 RepID=UPI001C206B3C|nr:gustatory receptor for sugar taste 43a-like [Aricia agestis]
MAENLRDSALGMVFRMSRVFGVAPVTFSRTNVHLSRRLMMCSSLFFTIIIKVLILYTGFYYESFCFTLFEYQFIAVATEVRSVLKMITNGLEELLKTDSGTQKYSEKREIIIHDLAKAYGDTCDLIRDVNDGFGLQLLLILMSYFLELIVTPYYLMTSLTNRDRDASHIVLQVFWALYHLTDMYYIIEPAYLTQLEIEKIEYLISRHVRQVKPHEALYVELKMFRRQLAFTRPTYSPMGVCTLSRQFCLSMLGCVTTYLVIILQFRANEG